MPINIIFFSPRRIVTSFYSFWDILNSCLLKTLSVWYNYYIDFSSIKSRTSRFESLCHWPLKFWISRKSFWILSTSLFMPSGFFTPRHLQNPIQILFFSSSSAFWSSHCHLSNSWRGPFTCALYFLNFRDFCDFPFVMKRFLLFVSDNKKSWIVLKLDV